MVEALPVETITRFRVTHSIRPLERADRIPHPILRSIPDNDRAADTVFTGIGCNAPPRVNPPMDGVIGFRVPDIDVVVELIAAIGPSARSDIPHSQSAVFLDDQLCPPNLPHFLPPFQN